MSQVKYPGDGVNYTDEDRRLARRYLWLGILAAVTWAICFVATLATWNPWWPIGKGIAALVGLGAALAIWRLRRKARRLGEGPAA